MEADPPLDAMKRERRTSTLINASSRKGSSTSKDSSSSDDTTPPTVVLVVPVTGMRYNKHREAPTPQLGTTTGANMITLADQNMPEILADERGEGKMLDGEMIYI